VSDKIISLYRSILTREKGSVRKDWGGKISVALTYPNTYRVGMSNLGFQIVYHLLNTRDDVVAERVFLPEDQEMSLHRDSGKGLLSMESGSMLRRFDIIAFSLSFENDYLNILKILQMAGTPLLSEERDETCPLVIAGGINSFLNPEPLASFFDLFLLGEAESNLFEFMDLFADINRSGSNRQESLNILARDMKSVYVPSLYHVEYNRDGSIGAREPVENSVPEKIMPAKLEAGKLRVNRSTILSPDTEFADRILVELGRGCGRSCRFCAAGYVYRPPRFHEKSEVISCVENALNECDRVGLLSASVLDTPGIADITSQILKKNGKFSVSSLRADSLTSGILQHIKDAGQRSLAIAPEAGTERMRRVINKHLDQGQIVDAVRMIASTEDFGLRLYFLVGLPTEERADVTGILELVKSIRHHMIKESRTRGRIGQIRLSVNCFIPKPFTPFQWFPMEEVSSLKKKQKWLKKAMSKEGGIRINFDVPKWAYVQTLLSMGDRRVGGMLMHAHELNGDWARTFRHSELNPDFFVHRPRSLDEILPWDFIDHGIRKEFLIKEYRLALKAKESDICNVGECDRCGVCEK